ncbi:TnsA endonuclease N-terminal domain-containing protein [Deinococcus sp.]|uniref:TnsA endonuclease N-terminal domain-containing protein n=1 Tax=Deinococcus sp. TaxID=47478 RepID=UPI0025BA361D|nr:TnsA endonuclease N-terminal domain-containing protein [Deinococcus sp.]
MDPVVERVLPQPVTLSFLDDSGRKRRYTPDVLVTYQCGRPPAMFEVKYSSELLEDADLYRCRFQAAAAYAAERDMTFAVITEDQIRTGRLQWATFLRPYCFRAPSPELEARLVGALESLGETTPAELLAGFPVHEHGILIPVLWQLVARHRVWMDSEAPVTMQSCLRYRAGT